MGAMSVLAVTAYAAAALLAPAEVQGHGWLEVPKARHICNNELTKMVYKGGGSGSGDKGVPLGGVPGFCGDPFMDKEETVDGVDHWTNFAGLPCEPQETYEAGGIVKSHIVIPANHGGFFMLHLCDSTDLSVECFEAHPLRTVEHDSDRAYIMGPIPDPKPDDSLPDAEDRAGEYHIDWKLPEGVTCDHCVLQWTYYTAHLCTWPCDREVCGWYADGFNYIVRPGQDRPIKQCDSLTPAFGERPQIFRNCADIRITGAGGAPATPTPTPTPESPEAPAQAPEEEEEEEEEVAPEEVVEATVEAPEVAPVEVEDEEVAEAPVEMGNDQEIVDEVSGAGDLMHCGDELVQRLLGELNSRRADRGHPALACDEKATGAAVNWSEMMCDEGALNSDKADNCHLAFERDCVEVLNMRDSKDDYALSGMNFSLKRMLYEVAELTTVGMGWFDCGGDIYWTVLASGADYSAAGAEAAQQPAAAAPPLPPPAPKQDSPKQASLGSWLAYFSQN